MSDGGGSVFITVIIDVGLCAKSAQFSSEQSQSCHRQRRGGQYAILLAAVPHKCIKLNAFHCRSLFLFVLDWQRLVFECL